MRNVNIFKVKIICIILVLSVGVIFMNLVSNMSKNSLEILEREYQNVENNNEIRVSSGSGRVLTQTEIEFLEKIPEIQNINLDYYLSLVLTNNKKEALYKAKVQEYREDLNYEYINMEEGSEGIYLPDISIQAADGFFDLRTLAGEDLYFEIEKVNDQNEAQISYIKIHVCGLYKTELNEYTAPILINSDILNQIYDKLGTEKEVYECDVTVKEPGKIVSIDKKIESIGLQTSYLQKSYINSKNNIMTFINFVRGLEYIVLALGLLVLIFFIRNKYIHRKIEFGVLKLLGYSSLFVTASFFIEIQIYFFAATVVAGFTTPLVISILSSYSFFSTMHYVELFSVEQVIMIFRCLGILTVLNGLICIVILIAIKKITPFQMLYENKCRNDD